MFFLLEQLLSNIVLQEWNIFENRHGHICMNIRFVVGVDMVSNITATVTWGDIRGFSTVFLYNEIEAIFGQTTTTMHRTTNRILRELELCIPSRRTCFVVKKPT